MKYLSLFSGIGGFEVALHQVFPDAECVGFSEIDKYAIQIYKKHFPEHTNLGDITKINPNSLSDFDMIFGGFPCQDLSIAKKDREGLKGKRSGLFWIMMDIVRIKKPKWFLFENVASMDKTNLGIISTAISEASGYSTCMLGDYVEPVMVNAALVSAQNRERLFWCNWEIRQPKDRGILLKDILESGEGIDGAANNTKSYCVDASYYKGGNQKTSNKSGKRLMVLDKNGDEKKKSNTIRSPGMGSGIDDKHNWDTIVINKPDRVGEIGKGGQGDRVYSIDGKSVSQSANSGGQGANTGLYAIALRNRGKGKEAEIGGDKASSLNTVQADSMVTDNYYIRKLTPVECERLQCFPDGYTEGISNTQRYKTLGNAVNTEVVKHIFEELRRKNETHI